MATSTKGEEGQKGGGGGIQSMLRPSSRANPSTTDDHTYIGIVELVRVGGVIAYDNTLWGGTVAAPPDAPLSDRDRMVSEIMRAFNCTVAADPRVEISHLSVADGLTLCRRLRG